MNRFLKLVLALCLLAGTQAFASDPVVPAAKPLRVVVHVNYKDPARWNMMLNNIKNAQNDVGDKNIEVEVVAHGPGLDLLKDDSVSATGVQQAMGKGVRFVACRNTMQAQHLTEADMIPNIGYAPAGVIELIRKQQEGWAYLRP